MEFLADDDQSSLNGEIIVLEGVYYRDVKINLLKEVTRRRRAQAPPPAPSQNPLLNRTQVSVVIRARNPLEVDNNLTHMAISPDLKVHGTLAQPTMSGRASVTEGQITYLGKTFIIRRGDIDFLNPYKMEPSLDIVSETPVRNGLWVITLGVTGTPDELVFTISSVPEETNNDIVSLLLFGKTSREIAEGQSGSTMSTRQLVAEMVASTLGDDIQKATGFDILELETTEDGQEDTERIKVTMGKNLSRRLAIKYAVESKDGEMTQRTISEYKLLENFLVNGFQDNKGIYGGELIFRLEFR
jgi:autotransporter translocation and assembly factor TamB